MITDYLGPNVLRGSSTGATLNALRVRLEQNEVTDARREDLCWQVREAIRTEVFKVKFPAPPSPRLLALIAATEVLLTAYAAPTRPFFFPGARVSVPAAGPGSVAGPPRPGTTLQLRFRKVEEGSVTEALVHLGGDDGGSFKWVQTSALAPLLDQTSLVGPHFPTPPPLPLPPPLPPQSPAGALGGRSLGPTPTAASTSLVPTTPSPHIPSNAVPQILPPRPHQPATTPSPALPSIMEQKQHQQQHIEAGDLQAAQIHTAKNVGKKPVPNSQPPSSQKQQKLPKPVQQATHPVLPHQKPQQKQPQQKQQQQKQPQQKQPQQALRLPPRPQSLMQAQQLTVLPPRGPGRVRRDDPRAVKPILQPGESVVTSDLLPSAFIPDALRATSPPPRKRIRTKIKGPVLLCSGSVLNVSSACDAEPSVSMFGGSIAPHATSIGDILEDVSLAEHPYAHISGPMASSQARGTRMRRGGMRSLSAMTAKVMLIDRLVARRENMSCGGVVEYCVKWTGIGWDGCSWESRDALLQDVPGLVLAFDTRHPEVPSRAIGQIREPTAAEAEEHTRRGAAHFNASEQRESSAPPEKVPPVDDPIMIPAWVDSPLVELNFSGMALHIRPDEWTLFSDPGSIVRDSKKRRIRFRQEFPEEFRRLFPITKGELAAKERNDAKAVIEGNMKKRKHFGSYPILFPRALGTVIRTELAPPVPRADIEQAPPSWEKYFINLGLECTNWEREFPPDMPTASQAVCRTVEHAKKMMAVDEQNRSRERTSRLIQERIDKEPGGIGGITAGAEDYLTKVRLATSVRTSLPPQQTNASVLDAYRGELEHVVAKQELSDKETIAKSITNGESDAVAVPGGDATFLYTGTEPLVEPDLLRNRNSLFENALRLAGPRSCAPPRWYDPVWCCWRYVQLANASPVSCLSRSIPSSEDNTAGAKPGAMIAAGKCNVENSSKERADFQEMMTAGKCNVENSPKERADFQEMMTVPGRCKDNASAPSEP
jgi:Chromo (CHRromatin Organisation MOdifier) domain